MVYFEQSLSREKAKLKQSRTISTSFAVLFGAFMTAIAQSLTL